MSNKSQEYRHGFEEWGCTDPDITYLGTGAPGEGDLTLCADIMRRATVHRMDKEMRLGHLFQYGPMQGDWEFRSQLASFLSAEYGDEVEREHLFVTCGATHGLHLVSTLLLTPGCVVFVEEPTYFIAINILKDDLGFKVIPVPTDGDGIKTDEFARLLNEENHLSTHEVSKRHPFWAMLYTVPTYSNPTGRCMSQARMTSLLSLARQHDILVFADDVYNLLHYDEGHPPHRLFTYDKRSDKDYKGHVISNGTFSKILAPGIRLGWLEAPERIVDSLLESHIMLSGGSLNHYMCGVMASALSLGLQQEHVKHLRQTYKNNMEIVYSLLQSNVPSSVHMTKPKGGYFIWITLPSGSDSEDLRCVAETKHGVSFKCGVSFSLTNSYQECLRVSISHYPSDVLITAAKALATAITEYLE